MAGPERHGSAVASGRSPAHLRVVSDRGVDSLALLTARLGDEVKAIVRTFFLDADRAALLPDLSPELHVALERAVEAGVGDALRRLRDRAAHPTRLPSEMDNAARLWAREGCELSRLIDVVDLARDVVRPSFERFAEQVIPDAEARWTLMSRAQRGLAGWTRAVNELLRRSYDAELRLAQRRISSERARQVNRILAGDSSARRELGYDLRLEHLAIVAYDDDGPATVRALAKQCGRELLAVDGLDGSVWGWLSGREPLAATAVGELIVWQSQRAGHVAFGEPASGVDGFRLSHEQAKEARDYAELLGETVVRYDDIALVALLADQPQRADTFARRELQGVDDDTPRSGELRETLDAYLRHGQNIKATALVRGAHRQTIRQQIRAIETRLRYPIDQRSAELMLALRLRRLSKPEVAI